MLMNSLQTELNLNIHRCIPVWHRWQLILGYHSSTFGGPRDQLQFEVTFCDVEILTFGSFRARLILILLDPNA